MLMILKKCLQNYLWEYEKGNKKKDATWKFFFTVKNLDIMKKYVSLIWLNT